MRSGELILWRQRNALRSAMAHAGGVDALHAGPSGLLSGGRDGTVRLWTPALELLSTYSVASLGSVAPAVRSVCWARDSAKVRAGAGGG